MRRASTNIFQVLSLMGLLSYFGIFSGCYSAQNSQERGGTSVDWFETSESPNSLGPVTILDVKHVRSYQLKLIILELELKLLAPPNCALAGDLSPELVMQHLGVPLCPTHIELYLDINADPDEVDPEKQFARQVSILVKDQVYDAAGDEGFLTIKQHVLLPFSLEDQLGIEDYVVIDYSEDEATAVSFFKLEQDFVLHSKIKVNSSFKPSFDLGEIIPIEKEVISNLIPTMIEAYITRRGNLGPLCEENLSVGLFCDPAGLPPFCENVLRSTTENDLEVVVLFPECTQQNEDEPLSFSEINSSGEAIENTGVFLDPDNDEITITKLEKSNGTRTIFVKVNDYKKVFSDIFVIEVRYENHLPICENKIYRRAVGESFSASDLKSCFDPDGEPVEYFHGFSSSGPFIREGPDFSLPVDESDFDMAVASDTEKVVMLTTFWAVDRSEPVEIIQGDTDEDIEIVYGMVAVNHRIEVVGDPPTCPDASFTVAEGEQYVLAYSCLDHYGKTLDYSIGQLPEKGSLQYDSDTGSFIYTAPTNVHFEEQDQFVIEGRDSFHSGSATISVTISGGSDQVGPD